MSSNGYYALFAGLDHESKPWLSELKTESKPIAMKQSQETSNCDWLDGSLNSLGVNSYGGLQDMINSNISSGLSPSSNGTYYWNRSSASSSPRNEFSDTDQNLINGSPARNISPNNADFNNVGTRYKTELCKSFLEFGECKYGTKCQFAHGPDELKSINRHPRYKTEPCRRFHEKGMCNYGTRCHFLHDCNEQQLVYGRLAAERQQKEQADLALANKILFQSTYNSLTRDAIKKSIQIAEKPLNVVMAPAVNSTTGGSFNGHDASSNSGKNSKAIMDYPPSFSQQQQQLISLNNNHHHDSQLLLRQQLQQFLQGQDFETINSTLELLKMEHYQQQQQQQQQLLQQTSVDQLKKRLNCLYLAHQIKMLNEQQ